MSRLLRLWCVLCACVCMSGAALAGPVLSLVPQFPKIDPPQNLLVDVVISGLRSGGTDTLLGAFDLTIDYDPEVVTLQTVGSTLGTALGDVTDPLQTFVGADASTLGRFRFFAVSLLEASSTDCFFCVGPYLRDLQSDSFTLASLLFFSPGAPPETLSTSFILSPQLTVLSDAGGNPITDVTIHNASVLVPEPSILALFGLALLALVTVSRRPRSNPSTGAQSL